MGTGIIFLLLILLSPVTAFAAAEKPPVSIERLCRELPNFQKSPDVDYIPGKDVYWRDVAPADVDATPQIEMNENITVNISAFQAQQLGLPNTIGYTPETYLGQATIKKDGSVFFNGQRLTQPQMQFLCDPEKNPKP
ncbi:MAG: hypothetical protein JWM96_469 [Alphaproteobacteria bacterium]|nr:hypothetical protein [Alphaproteobacteria bacterium]